MRAAAILVGAYLLGSVPWSYLIVRFARRQDIRKLGSGNVGATNVLRAAGRLPAALALLLDIGKGAAAVAAARAAELSPALAGAAALAVIAGHVFPVFLGFRGGKGVATTAGAFGTLAPLPALLSAAAFVLVVLWGRWVSLGSIVAVALFPVFLYLGGLWGFTAAVSPPLVASAVAAAALVVARHASNLRRLRAGTEPRLGHRSGEGASA
jgi:glycerol-3-phosphate acyltransferase PlsY